MRMGEMISLLAAVATIILITLVMVAIDRYRERHAHR